LDIHLTDHTNQQPGTQQNHVSPDSPRR